MRRAKRFAGTRPAFVRLANRELGLGGGRISRAGRTPHQRTTVTAATGVCSSTEVNVSAGGEASVSASPLSSP